MHFQVETLAINLNLDDATCVDTEASNWKPKAQYTLGA
jgi:hypothetical protein